MNFFLDLLFPRRCVSCGRVGSYICDDCYSKIEFVENPVCPVCQRQAVSGKTHPGCVNKYRLDGLVVACRYRGPVKVAIAKVKYKWVYDIGKILVDLIVNNMWRFDLPAGVILVPVPLHIMRKRWRGFNQAEILAKQLAKQFNVTYAALLFRNRETKTQVGLKKDKRRENVRGAFSLRLAPLAQGRTIADVEGKNIVLVDDVYTSGATMGECARVLKRAGANNVWGIAVALG